MNNVNKNIKVDLRHSTRNIEFLDLKVIINGDSLCTDVFTKPTDTKAYLQFTSDHPEPYRVDDLWDRRYLKAIH